jgi:hypothetical protein
VFDFFINYEKKIVKTNNTYTKSFIIRNLKKYSSRGTISFQHNRTWNASTENRKISLLFCKLLWHAMANLYIICCKHMDCTVVKCTKELSLRFCSLIVDILIWKFSLPSTGKKTSNRKLTQLEIDMLCMYSFCIAGNIEIH